jgi:two-component system nitrogen regulation response regulator NtrX
VSETRVLVVDDEADIRELLDEILSEEGYEVATAADAEEARRMRAEQDFGLILLDIWMPGTDGISLLKEWADRGDLVPVIMMSGHGTVETAVEATRLGAVDFIEKPVSLTTLLKTLQRALAQKRQQPRRSLLVPSMVIPVGKSEAMRVLRETIEKLARDRSHVLFTGEPGSGRETFVRYLKLLGHSPESPLVYVMGSEFNDADAARVLFGGDGEKGVLDRAGGGMLFINEISEMSPVGQQLLLGVLEKDSYRPDGAKEDRAPDVRIIASAPSGFERSKDFNAELLHFLSGVIVRVPPLRQYSEDVPELLRYYVELLVDSENLPFRRFTVAAQNRLRHYPWPGNVRELKNLVRTSLLLSSGEEVTLEDVESLLESPDRESESLVQQDLLSLPMREAREQFERAYLKQQLQLCGGRVGQLARRIGMERTHLYRKLRGLGVEFKSSDD